MTTVIHRENWKDFAERISREKLDWKTYIQIISKEIGAQIFSEDLPFSGLTFDDKNGAQKFELSVGRGTENHQTHNVFDPRFVACEESPTGHCVLDIEDSVGNKITVRLVFP